MHASESRSRGLCMRECLRDCLREWELVAAREFYSKNLTLPGIATAFLNR